MANTQMKTKTRPSSVMSSQLKTLLSDPDSADIIQQLMVIITSAPNAAARRERTIAIQGFAELMLSRDSRKN